MRRLLIYAQDGVAPATAELDLAASIPNAYRNTGPLLASVSFWVHTHYVRLDPEEAGGGWNLELQWLDPVDVLRTLPGTPVNINDPDKPAFVSQTMQVNRKSGTSLLKAMLSGSNVGTSLVSYRIVLLPSVAGDLIFLP